MSEDILIKYLLGEATPEEGHAIEAWVAGNSENARKLEQVRIILEAGKRLAQQSPLSGAEAWAKFKHLRAAGEKSPRKVRKVVPLARYRWLQTAAAILLVIGGGWLAYYFYSDHQSASAQWVSLTATNNVRVDTLPDGSVVHLNKNSSIAFAANFKGHRAVKLNGEAFFEVRHDEDRPFTVQAKGILIKDIGTAFNVKINKLHIEVIVESGIVSVSRQTNLVKLNAMERVVVSEGDKTLKVESSKDQLYNYYRTKKFFANNTPLRRLVEVLNEAYNTDIKISNNALQNTPITVTIKLEDSLEKVLKVLQATTPEMKVDRSGAQIILH